MAYEAAEKSTKDMQVGHCGQDPSRYIAGFPEGTSPAIAVREIIVLTIVDAKTIFVITVGRDATWPRHVVQILNRNRRLRVSVGEYQM